MDLKARIEEMIVVIREAELRHIEAATAMIPYHEEWKREMEVKLARLRACETAQQVSNFLYKHHDLGATRKFIFEFDLLVYAEMQIEVAGWEFISFEKHYGTAAEQVRKNLVVKDPQGKLHKFEWGNSGANGMRSEFQNYGTPPTGMPLKVLNTEMMRRMIREKEPYYPQDLTHNFTA